MPLDLTLLIQTFREESEEDLGSMERTLIALSGAPGNAEAVRGLFRAAHTLKGNALSLGFGAAAEIAHAAEDSLARARAGTEPLAPETVTALLAAVDVLRTLVRADPSPILTEAQRTLAQQLRSGAPAPAAATKAPEARASAAEPTLAAPESARAAEPAEPRAPSSIPRVATAPAIKVAPAVASAPDWAKPGAGRDDETDVRTKSVRVPVEKLDALMRLVGEVVVARELVKDVLLRENTPLTRRLLALQTDVDRAYDDLQERVIATRLVPVGILFEQQARGVWETARAVGKQVRLVNDGAETEVDLAVIEHLRDPLLHAVRNAIDHGIEPPQVRRARGKSAEGTLRLSARREGSSVLVEVHDDGAGIDRERVLAKARALGVVPAGAHIDDADALDLIFAPGLSTAGEVSEISGRGVGMDVVRRNVTTLGGSVTVASESGVGTTLRIRVPLTVGILRGFVVRVAHETYVAPIDGVEECIELYDAAPGAESGMANLRGEPVPWLRLRRALAVTHDPPEARETLLILRHESQRVGLLVDTIAGESQLVVRPLGRLLRQVRGVSATAILGDGRACLVLDAGGLAADASRRRSGSVDHLREAP